MALQHGDTHHRPVFLTGYTTMTSVPLRFVFFLSPRSTSISPAKRSAAASKGTMLPLSVRRSNMFGLGFKPPVLRSDDAAAAAACHCSGSCQCTLHKRAQNTCPCIRSKCTRNWKVFIWGRWICLFGFLVQFCFIGDQKKKETVCEHCKHLPLAL